MAEVTGNYDKRSLYLITFDLDRSSKRTNDYGAIDLRLMRMGEFVKPTMQIRLLACQQSATQIRQSLLSATFESRERKGSLIFQPDDRIFIMRLSEPHATNRPRQGNLLEWAIAEYAQA